MTLPALQVVEGGSAGAILEEARRQRGQSLDQAAAATRIRRRHLEALERGDLDALPGPVYARGYLRTYAEHLGLASGPLLESLSAAAPAPAATGRLLSLRPLSPARLPGRLTLTAPRLAIAGLLLAAALFAAYAWREIDSARSLGGIAAAPSEGSLTLSAPPIASPFALPSAAPSAAAPGAPQAAAAQILVGLRAVEETWVTVTVDGRSAYAGLLQPGRDLTFAGRRIRVGAGKPSLLVSIAGGDFAPLGVLSKEYSADT